MHNWDEAKEKWNEITGERKRLASVEGMILVLASDVATIVFVSSFGYF